MKKSVEIKKTNKRQYKDRIIYIKTKQSANSYINSEIIAKNNIKSTQPN